MRLVGDETCPLPEDPVLAATASTLNEAGYWGEVVDRDWRGLFLTDEARWMCGGRAELAGYPVGGHFLGPQRAEAALGWRGGQFPLDILRQAMTLFGPYILADPPGGRDELRGLVEPRLRDIVDTLSPIELAASAWFTFRGIYTAAGTGVDINICLLRLRNDRGEVVGTAILDKPAVGMATLTRMTAMGDLRHFQRIEQVARPGRRPAAVLFADLESSSPLSRRLSTA